MDVKNVLVFFGILLNFYFVILIHFRSERNKANTIFEFTVYAIIGWCLSMLFYRSLSVGVEFWARLLYFFPTFIPTGFLLFGLHFPKAEVNKKYLYIIALINIFMASLTQLPGAVIDKVVIPEVGEKIIYFGWAYYYLYIVYIPVFFLASYYVLFRKYQVSNSTVKRQIVTILVGLIIASSVGMVTNLTLPTLGIFSANWAGQFFTFIWVGGATYAIIRHGFLNIKVLATQLFVAVILLILLARLFTFTSLNNFILDLAIFIIIVIFSVLLVRGVMGEVKQKEVLKELNERLKVLDAQKDEFISVAAHELRSPLTSIKGYVSMLLHGDAGMLPKDAMDFLMDTSLASERMIRLIRNMLDVGRIEEGRIVYQMGFVNLCEAVRVVFKEFQAEADLKKLNLALRCPEVIKDSVYVDKDRIYEVISNFLSNAIKYTDKGGVVVKLSNPDSDTIRFEVEDTGPGITQQDRKSLFQKFYRSRAHAGQVEGTGLGLYVSRLLIEKFEGKIGVQSEVDKGSTFWFELPLVENK